MSNQINLSIADENFDQAKDAHYQLSELIKSKDILTKLKEFDEEKYKLHPVFQFVRQYMHMVHLLIMFVRSVRTGNWNLHLQSLEAFVKFFFVHDKHNYARLIPLYLAEMHSLKDTDPHIYAEFEKGDWVVNKNSVPFCSIGGDHALEHLNCAMKVSGGLVGITLNENARTRFFLIAPELHCLSSQANDLANLKSSTPTKHHTFTNVVTNRQQKYVLKLLTALKNFTNPFKYDGDDLINLVMSNVKDDVCNHAIISKILRNKDYI